MFTTYPDLQQALQRKEWNRIGYIRSEVKKARKLGIQKGISRIEEISEKYGLDIHEFEEWFPTSDGSIICITEEGKEVLIRKSKYQWVRNEYDLYFFTLEGYEKTNITSNQEYLLIKL